MTVFSCNDREGNNHMQGLQLRKAFVLNAPVSAKLSEGSIAV